ncbi:hypothetical protein EDC94DRAFT_615636 [Helicostylum pulchrum]|nr:hypothetical protein EDC94DRAFT_615636 [Helicostylum pulchrum]
MYDYKPDILATLKLKHGMQLNFFVCEVKKTPSGCSANKYESDFVKVHREMKVIINQQIDLGIDGPVCFALLVEGHDCYLYRMSLEYEAEYMQIAINSPI